MTVQKLTNQPHASQALADLDQSSQSWAGSQHRQRQTAFVLTKRCGINVGEF